IARETASQPSPSVGASMTTTLLIAAMLMAQVGVALERGPALEELARVHGVEVGADHRHDALGVAGEQVPVEDRLALVDVDDLDVVNALGRREHGRGETLATHDEPVARLGAHHASTTFSPSHTAGTSRTPRATARAVACSRRSPTPRSCAAFITAAGCISQAAAAMTTLSGSASERPPAKAWR